MAMAMAMGLARAQDELRARPLEMGATHKDFQDDEGLLQGNEEEIKLT